MRLTVDERRLTVRRGAPRFAEWAAVEYEIRKSSRKQEAPWSTCGRTVNISKNNYVRLAHACGLADDLKFIEKFQTEMRIHVSSRLRYTKTARLREFRTSG